MEIVGATLWVLIATYFVLIWRINKLILTLERTKAIFVDLHQFFGKLKDNSSGLLQLANRIDRGELEVHSEKYGRFTVGRKKEEKR